MRPGLGGRAPLFGRLDTNADGKLQAPELRRAIELLESTLDKADGGDISLDQWGEIMKELQSPPK